MGLFENILAAVAYLWPSQQESLQSRSIEAFAATGLMLVPVSQREKTREDLAETVMPEDHRQKGIKHLAHLDGCRHPSQEETRRFLEALGDVNVPKDPNDWLLFGSV
ncbi:hypothetical protein GGR57DRAFT_497948 [Xylariaceae sp. FL1272]|nr:hypothetical protein GGR57DRAFT_505748 [Xylariaceae sp. FL1272]KAI0163863.1 hypothetical protein GGR57DRAFT_497948 [Xylariaceae sp. FL1272]